MALRSLCCDCTVLFIVVTILIGCTAEQPNATFVANDRDAGSDNDNDNVENQCDERDAAAAEAALELDKLRQCQDDSGCTGTVPRSHCVGRKQVVYAAEQKHGAEVRGAGFSVDATFILGGQIGTELPICLLVYPQGNWIETAPQTPFHQIGETKYGKPILQRVITADTDLDEVARCALISMDSTMQGNATVGPPIEVLCLPAGKLSFSGYLHLDEDAPYLTELKRSWDASVRQAFQQTPRFEWGPFPVGERFH